MVTESAVWQAAWIIAEQYGPEGVAFATRMASSFEIGGKADAQRTWASIAEKVGALTQEMPPANN